MSEDCTGDSPFVIPPDDVRVPKALDQHVEKLIGNRRIDSAGGLRLVQIYKQQEKRPVGQCGSLAFVRQEVPKGLLVVRPGRIEIPREITGSVIRVLRHPRN